MQDIILLRGQNLSYAKEKESIKDRILGREDHLLLKDVSFTLYKGEVLGVLSIYDTLYYIKEIVNGTIDPKSGKIKADQSILSLDVMDHIHHPHHLNVFLRELFDEYLTPQRINSELEALKEHGYIRKYWDTPIKELSRREIALILLEISLKIDVEVIVFCNIYSHLHEADYPRYKEVLSYHENDEKGVLLLESEIEPIKASANYFLWLSYGQVRYDGSVQKGAAEYQAYLKLKSQVKNVDEEALFDLEWKENISEYAKYKYDLKRLNMKQTTIIDALNVRRIILSLVLLFIMAMSALIVLMDIDFTGSGTETAGNSSIIDTGEDEERISYGLVKGDNMSIGGTTIPSMTLLNIVSTNGETYTVNFNGENHEVPRDELIYFNPASLFPETSLEDLLPYTNQTFIDNYLFYTSYLNESEEYVTERLSADTVDDYQISLSGLPITYHLRDGYVLSLTTSASDLDDLYEEFNLTEDIQIFRLEDGYMILDRPNELWTYINR
jgi:teichoic acid transport system ATP-binding protein